MRGELLKSTPLRLALSLSAIFIVSLTLASVVAYGMVRRELAARVDRALTDTFAVISQSYGDNDIADLVAAVESHAGTVIDGNQIFRLTDGSGAVLAGNLGPVSIASGWGTYPAARLQLGNASHYRTLGGAVGDNFLVIGQSSAESDAIGGLTLAAFAWAAALLTLLIVTAGIIVAVRAQKRLDSIAGTMRRIGQGELAARIPPSPRNDDIAALAGQVNAALDRLSALVEGMRQVSVDIAHDLKTPLNRLAITIETAIEAEQNNLPLNGLLAQAQSEGEQINATFDALLRIAQIEAGSRRERFAAQDLPALLESVVEIYTEVAVERRQALTLQPARGLALPIAGDRELLTQLFVNLIENALRHGPAGITVSIAVEGNSDRVVVTVTDTGPGIPEVERDNVFRRLYRLDKARTTAGSGLGLSLVKAIADLHGATIELADNRPGLSVVLVFPTSVTER
ncbi:MAG TPA: HAMP domain-containing sensor histidine kinase [Devosiaceae bacterium]|jgi:signal transduction histidine kinase